MVMPAARPTPLRLLPAATLAGEAPRPLPGSTGRALTLRLRQQAIERTIRAMHERLAEPFSLQQMAAVAILSPYHFNRVFCETTGLPPCRFLASLRVEAARRLLLTSQLSVTDVCLEVGYQSLGTFITQFTELVGLSPRRLRRLAAAAQGAPAAAVSLPAAPRLEASGRLVVGRVAVPDGAAGPIFVGQFPAPIPQGKPLACALLRGPGLFQLAAAPVGRSYLFAVAFPEAATWLDYLLPETARLRVGGGVAVGGGPGLGGGLPVGAEPATAPPLELTLRPPRLTDPPILVALPFLLADRAAASRAAARRPEEVERAAAG